MSRPTPSLPTIDTRERGGPDAQGEPRFLDQRRFFQLLVADVAGGCSVSAEADRLLQQLSDTGVPGVVYADVNNPRGLGLLTSSLDPADFVTAVRPLFDDPTRDALQLRPGWSMFGRTYSIGYEQNLVDRLLERPLGNALNADYPWAVWYPLRRQGGFNRLDPREQRRVLGEHGTIGRAYGQQGLATDVRLACHGLDGADNDFVIGLMGPDLHPLSHLVQRMRATEQTGEWMEKMGPFFIGHVHGRHAG